MNNKRLFAAGFFSLALAVSPLGVNSVWAENSPSVPILQEAKAKNTGGTAAKEAGDSIVIEFSETTNKYVINSGNIDDELQLSNSHSFLDGAGALGAASWSDDGEKLKLILSAGASLPTVEPGDTVTVVGTGIKDLDNNAVTGNAVIKGSFTAISDDENEDCVKQSVVGTSTSGDEDADEVDDADEADDADEVDDEDSAADEDSDKDEADEEDDSDEDSDQDCDDNDQDDDSGKYRCGNGLQNGRLYKLESSQTVYLLAACRFHAFRGSAAFNSRGHKFEDIQVLDALPPHLSISDKPVLPAAGTLIKGSDKTVWFVVKSGKRRGFMNAEVFTELGFRFEQVDEISDSDLSEIETDTAINDGTVHPDGSLIKCGNSPTVFVVIDNLRFPFANVEAFQNRGHSFDHILLVDCGRFAYKEAPPITE